MSSSSVNFGILSTSAIVEKVLPGVKKAGNVSGVASRDKNRAQEFSEKHDAGRGLKSPRDCYLWS